MVTAWRTSTAPASIVPGVMLVSKFRLVAALWTTRLYLESRHAHVMVSLGVKVRQNVKTVSEFAIQLDRPPGMRVKPATPGKECSRLQQISHILPTRPTAAIHRATRARVHTARLLALPASTTPVRRRPARTWPRCPKMPPWRAPSGNLRECSRRRSEFAIQLDRRTGLRVKPATPRAPRPWT